MPIAGFWLFALLFLLPPLAMAEEEQSNGKVAVTTYQPPSVFLEELTWPEVRQAMKAGYLRVLVPTGGTEQNGEHMLLGKHNRVIHHTAEQIAKRLGNTLVAPVMAYVPEAMQMAYPGTLSLSDATFQAVLEDTAISLKTHGFRQIYLLGDSFGNQEPQEEAVEELAEDFAEEGIRLASLDEYYAANGQMEWLKEQGFSEEEIGGHAGIRDTSEIMALYPQGIRPDKLADRYGANESGANGKSTAASATIGQKMLELKIEAALRQIRSLEAEALDK